MRTPLKLEGQRFGKLTVLRRDGSLTRSGNTYSRWICACDCGNETFSDSCQLTGGHKVSCGCGRNGRGKFRKGSMIGQKFFRLTVIGHGRKENGAAAWKCVCECGKEVFRMRYELVNGNNVSCGCLRAELFGNRFRKAAPRESAINRHILNYKRSASKRDLEWSLTDWQFVDLATRCCHYCGEPPVETPTFLRHCKSDWRANGVDRLDSSIGYTSENCVPCCSRCNRVKNKYGYEEFLDLCRTIAERHPKQRHLRSAA